MEKYFHNDAEKQKELEAYVANMPQIVPPPKASINSSQAEIGLECNDWLAVVVVSELANVNPEPAWRHHDEKCDCEIATSQVESLI